MKLIKNLLIGSIIGLAHMAAAQTLAGEVITDGHTYEVDATTGITCTNKWIIDRIHNPETFMDLQFVKDYATKARTAVIDQARGKVYVGYSKSAVVDSTSNDYAHLVVFDLKTGKLEKELPLTYNGTAINGLLCANQVGIDDFGNVWICGMYPDVNAKPAQIYVVEDFNTGECDLVGEWKLPDEETDAAGRIDYWDVVGDITGVEANAVCMGAVGTTAAGEKLCLYRWELAQGATEWVANEDDFAGYVSNTDLAETYPADQVSWGSSFATVRIVAEEGHVGSMFYVDGFTTCPSLYQTSLRMVESFASAPDLAPQVGANGVEEFSLNGKYYLAYVEAQYNVSPGCRVNICELGNGGTFEGMRKLWSVPEAGLGEVSDGGTRIHNIDTYKVVDQNGKEGVYLLTYKCNNGIGLYLIAEDDFIDPLGTPVESIAIDLESTTIKTNSTLQLNATITPLNATNGVIQWSSTDETVATVASNGLVTAVSAGETQIIATTTDGSNLSDTCNIKVIDNNAIKIADAKMQIGENYIMPMELENTNSITAFQCDIHLPQGVSISEIDGEMDITLNENRASSDHTLAYRMLNDTTVRVIAYSMNINPFENNDGEVMTLNLYVDDTAEEGVRVMKIDSIILSGVNDDAYYLEPVMSNIEIYRYELGDANGDKAVNITDVVSIINAVMGNTPSNFQFNVADINGDSKINVLDVVAVAKIILSQTASTATTMSAMSGNAPNMLVLNNVSIQLGETQTVAVSLENVTDFTGFQMDLSLPEGITAENYRLTSRGAVSHTLNVQQGANGITRMISYSPTLATYKNHTGALLTFDIVADETFSGAGAIQIGNIIFADKDAQGYKLNTTKATIGSTSGVESVESTTAVYGEGKNIVIVSPKSSQATITNVLGQSRTIEVEVGVTKIPVQDNGMYIVTTNGITEKVIIK